MTHTHSNTHRDREITRVTPIRRWLGYHWEWVEGWHFNQVPAFEMTNVVCVQYTDGSQEYLQGKVC